MRHRYPSATVPARGEVSLFALTDVELDLIATDGRPFRRLSLAAGMALRCRVGTARLAGRGRLAVWWPGMWWGARP